ncbi:prenylated Rab acceptor protein 1 [Chiloscyllium plagiosum]|uniref:prenylated Rab acceptor protein 1 n=1 Tax=Chiloscyllium plagiosum TaxID=36176 RepID=UPI001CB7E204|nr:prenylated Rab acceptor protein 1 [Chiloscyllium plagiosum]
MSSKPDDVFSLTKEEEASGVTGRIYIPKIISQGPAKEWIERRRLTIRPWASFIDQKRFSRPKNFGEMCKRLVKNVEYFQSNYVFVFLGLIVYCVITSPMLLIALVVFFGACYIVHLRASQSRLVLFGKCPSRCFVSVE